MPAAHLGRPAYARLGPARGAGPHTGPVGRRKRRRVGRRPVEALDYSSLPERVRPEQMVTTQEVEPAPDPRGGRDTETEFMLRNAGV